MGKLYRDIVEKNSPIVYKIINNSYKRNSISHAYIFAGQKGVEIINEPFFLMQTLISEDPFASEKLRNVEKYVDLIQIDGSKERIKKENVINSISKMHKTPLEENGKKILFIKNLENANKSSFNSLLKFLEEPTKNTYIIMTTNNINKIITTIKSRSQIITLRQPSLNHFVNQISSEIDVKESDAKILASISSSSGEAINLYAKGEFQDLWKQIKKNLKIILTNKEKTFLVFNNLIQKKSYALFLSLLKVFFNDIWKEDENLNTITDELELIKKYRLSDFDYQKALFFIDDFFTSAEVNVNFNLQKTKFLLNLKKCFD